MLKVGVPLIGGVFKRKGVGDVMVGAGDAEPATVLGVGNFIVGGDSKVTLVILGGDFMANFFKVALRSSSLLSSSLS
jgi:hypothetical protein